MNVNVAIFPFKYKVNIAVRALIAYSSLACTLEEVQASATKGFGCVRHVWPWCCLA